MVNQLLSTLSSRRGKNLIDKTPVREAKDALVKTDVEVPRVVEDVFESLSATSKAKVPQASKDKIVLKQTLRAEYLALYDALTIEEKARL